MDAMTERLALLAEGMQELTIAQLDARLAALGYRRSPYSACRHTARWMTGPRAGQTHPAISYGLDEADTCRAAFHYQSRRDDRFAALQRLRSEVFAVQDHAIVSI